MRRMRNVTASALDGGNCSLETRSFIERLETALLPTLLVRFQWRSLFGLFVP